MACAAGRAAQLCRRRGERDRDVARALRRDRSTAALDYPSGSYPLFAMKSRDWRDDAAHGAGDRRRARLRNQRRAWRAAVRRPARGALCGPGQPGGRAVREPVGLRAHPSLERRRDRSEPLVSRGQPGAGVGGADAAGGAVPRSRAGAHRSA